jgi:hypothetical protein
MDNLTKKILGITFIGIAILIVLLFPIKQGDVFVPMITHLVDNRTECAKGNPNYELITGCPDYEYTLG